MPKHLITAIGLVVSLGVIALGVILVALPLYFQSVGVDGQTATVANTNAIYQAQVDALRLQEENLDAINASVDDLRTQLPASGQLDDVFEVVARAAVASGVTLSAVTAGEQVEFVAHTEATEGGTEGEPVPEPAPSPTTEGTDATTTDTTTEGAGEAAEAAPAVASGRQQVDFVIVATADDMSQTAAFLDALRAGPRLLSTIATTASENGEGGVDLQLSLLTYVNSEG